MIFLYPNWCKVWFFVLACTIVIRVSGQENIATTLDDQSYRQAFRVSLIGWLDPLTSSARAGFDYKVANRGLVRHEAGYYFLFNLGDTPAGLRDLSGFSFQTTFRRLSLPDAPGSRSRAYYDFNLIYRYLAVEVAGDFSRDNFSFSQRINYQVWENSIGLSAAIGRVLKLGQHFSIDLSAGFGLLVNYQSYSPIPDDARFITNEGLTKWEYRSSDLPLYVPIIPLSCSILYHW